MKSKLLFVLYLFLCSGLFAQTQEWVYSDTAGGIYGAFNINIDVNSNLYIGGPGYGPLSPYGVTSEALVIKLDNAGHYHWNQGFLQPMDVEYFGMTGDNTGNNYVFGEYDDIHTQFNGYLAKVDSSGKLNWAEKFDADSAFDAFNNAMVDKDGNLLVAGTSDNQLGQEMVSLKFRAADSIPVFSTRYNEYSTYYNSYFAQTDNAGGMYNIGQAAFNAGNNIVLLKYDSTGHYKWPRIISSTALSDEEPASTNADAKGNLYIVDNSNPDPSNPNTVPFVVKVDVLGNTLWQNLFADTSNNYSLTSSAIDTTALYIAGAVNTRMFLAKISAATGDTLWTLRYDTGKIHKILLKNNAIYTAGSIINAYGGLSFFTAKWNLNGNLQWSATYSDTLHQYDKALDLVGDNAGNIYVAGQSYPTGNRGYATVVKYHDNRVACSLNIQSIAVTDASTDTSKDGSAIAVLSGGNGPFRYHWSNGGSSDTITGLGVNQYCLTVTDANNCTASACDSVTRFICTLAVSSVHPTNVSPCFNGHTGAIIINTTGGVNPLSYSIDSGNTYQQSNTFNSLSAGTYYIELKDTRNCKAHYASNPVNITQPVADTPAVSIASDTFSTGQYNKYRWYFNGHLADTSSTYIVGDRCGTVYVQVTDPAGCIFNSSSYESFCEGISSLGASSVEMTLYPNPFGKSLNVKLDGVTNYNTIRVAVFDLCGQMLYEDKPWSNNFSVPTAALPVGMYVIRLNVDGQYLYRQVVKAGGE